MGMQPEPSPTDESVPSGRLQRLLDTYVRTASSPSLADIRSTLWSESGNAAWQRGDADYGAAVLEQYKSYVEMADRVSARRGAANTFFLSLNTAVFTAVGLFADHSHAHHAWPLIVPLVVLLGQCAAWFWILRSYRQLNSAKYAVVGALEERLPASPYWAAEWSALGGGRDPSRYWPLSHVESWIPALFAVAYVAGFVVLQIS